MDLLERVHTEFSEEQQKKCYDALAIYNYSRLSGYSEKYCDMFAEAVQAMVDQKRIQKLYKWEKAATAGAEDYKKVLNRGQTGWEKKQLGKAMLEAYVGLDDQNTRDVVICELAESESIILEAMEEFNLMLEAKTTKGKSKTAKETRPMTTVEKEKAARLKEMEEKAKAEKKAKMKKRIKKAAIIGGAVALTAGAAYVGTKKVKANKVTVTKIDDSWKNYYLEVREMEKMVKKVERYYRSIEYHPDTPISNKEMLCIEISCAWDDFVKKSEDLGPITMDPKIRDFSSADSAKKLNLVNKYHSKILELYNKFETMPDEIR